MKERLGARSRKGYSNFITHTPPYLVIILLFNLFSPNHLHSKPLGSFNNAISPPFPNFMSHAKAERRETWFARSDGAAAVGTWRDDHASRIILQQTTPPWQAVMSVVVYQLEFEFYSCKKS
ncbi:hypothetical protein, partial [Larkinella harenae]